MLHFLSKNVDIHDRNIFASIVSEMKINMNVRKRSSAKREISRGSPRPASNMGAWDSQILPYDPRGQHASARGRPGATGAKVPMLGANETNEAFSELWS